MTTNTDINELAQQLRKAAITSLSAPEFGSSDIAGITRLRLMKPFADLARPKNILLILDALEAAQKRIEKADIEISQWVSVAEAAGQDDIAWHKLADRDSELICKLADSMLKIIERAEKAEKRVSELEASQPVVPNELLKIGELIRTQDNRITDQPLFAVMQKREYVGHEDYSAGGHDRIVWVDEYGGEADERTSRRLESLNRACRDTRGWERLKMFEVDEFVTACFTEQGCKDHIAINGHNLNKPFVYAFGSFRNAEYRTIRDWLIAAPALQEG